MSGRVDATRNTPANCRPHIAAVLQAAFRQGLPIAGTFGKQVPPSAVNELHEDVAGPSVFVDLACSGHQAMWEMNRNLLFTASVDWLLKGEVAGVSRGELKLGYGQ